MSRPGRLAVATLGAYLLGSVQSADIAARLAARRDGSGRKDLRTQGTGNPGGLNAAKVLGTRWGLGVIGADIASGAVMGVGTLTTFEYLQQSPSHSHEHAASIRRAVAEPQGASEL